MRGGTVSAWLAAILAGMLGSTVGFGRIEAGTAAGGHATDGQLAGGSAVPPKAPGGNSPPARQGQQQGPKEEPRPSKPTTPVSQPGAKTGRRKGQSDPIEGGKVEQVKEIIAYGKQQGVGIWLYLNDVAGRTYPLEPTLKQYSDWGAVGIKYGFMRGTPAQRNARTRLITERAAAHQLMVNFHDGPVHPYGQMRTFPNAMTREFCHSQLDAHRVYQPITFVTSVFVNMLAGPIDMCNGLADLTQANRVDEPSPVPSTLAGEGARTLIVFSGTTIIPDIPENYRKHPEILEFIAAQKMPWRESQTLSGVIGEHIVMARQAADGAWLVGAATNEDPRTLDVPLDFLGEGTFEALVIQDGPGSDYRTHVESTTAERRKVTAADRVRLKLAPGGGGCILLRRSVP
jgi:alpha-glucosidase